VFPFFYPGKIWENKRVGPPGKKKKKKGFFFFFGVKVKLKPQFRKDFNKKIWFLKIQNKFNKENKEATYFWGFFCNFPSPLF